MIMMMRIMLVGLPRHCGKHIELHIHMHDVCSEIADHGCTQMIHAYKRTTSIIGDIGGGEGKDGERAPVTSAWRTGEGEMREDGDDTGATASARVGKLDVAWHTRIASSNRFIEVIQELPREGDDFDGMFTVPLIKPGM